MYRLVADYSRLIGDLQNRQRQSVQETGSKGLSNYYTASMHVLLATFAALEQLSSSDASATRALRGVENIVISPYYSVAKPATSMIWQLPVVERGDVERPNTMVIDIAKFQQYLIEAGFAYK